MTTGTLMMPSLGETMEEGKIIGWLVGVADKFERGQPILEVETDKTVVELPALGAGTLVETLVEAGDIASVGAPICRVAVAKGPDWTVTEAPQKEPDSDTVVVKLNMPRLGETMDEGKVVGWMKAVGENFVRGEALLEVETDKTVVEFPALVAGTLVSTFAQVGETVSVGEAIAEIRVATKDAGLINDDTGTRDQVLPVVGEKPSAALEAVIPRTSINARVRATPAARQLARRNGIDIAIITGTGRRGRIEVEDVVGINDNRASSVGVKVAHNISYAETGPLGGENFLLIHGYSGDHKTFSGVANQLKTAGHRAVSIDLPGHGVTLIEANNVAALSDNLEIFSNRVFGSKPFHLVAHSLGAVPAVELAENTRVASLTLLAPAGIGMSIDNAFIQVMAAPNSQAQVNHMLRQLSAGSPALSERMIEALYAQLCKGRLTDLAKDFVGARGQTVDIIPVLEGLSQKIPVRVIVGHQDKIIKWQDALQLPPMVSVHYFKGAGHMPHWDQLNDVVGVLTRDIK